MAVYDSDGKIRLTIVDGNTRVGPQAADGSYNVVQDDAGGKGFHHRSGAFRMNSSNGAVVQDSSGAHYINHFMGSLRGGVVVAGGGGGTPGASGTPVGLLLALTYA